jgi:hypothetical protein
MRPHLKRAGLGALALLCLLLSGASTPNSIVTPQTPNIKCVQFLQGTDAAATYKTVYAGGTNATKIVGLYATSFDPSASHLLTVQISSSSSGHCSPATSCFGGMAITLPVSAGSANAVPALNLISSVNWPGLPRDSDGNPFIYLPTTSYTIEATFTTSLTASDWINVCAIGADF